jgi:TRAP-type C4-dicarboxylate transport system permease small subunit
MEAFVRGVRLLSNACGVVAALLIGAGVVVVCEMVLVRYAFNETTIWQTDFVTYCLTAATFVGSPYVLMIRGFVVTIAVLTYNLWLEAWEKSWVSDTMWRARLWIPYASMPIGLAILALQSLADLGNLLTGREPPFGIRGERK